MGALQQGLPWEAGVKITPLPEPKKPAYLQELLADALSKGATLANAAHGGGALAEGGTLMTPAVVYPVTPAMRLWHEEQFGPLVPVGVFHDEAELAEHIARSPYGQQAAILITLTRTPTPTPTANPNP